jgi:hypothetical protein
MIQYDQFNVGWRFCDGVYNSQSVFFRFWKCTRDRFFLLFASSFSLEGLSRIIITLINIQDQKPLIYLLRMVAYILILWAIYDKNKRNT